MVNNHRKNKKGDGVAVCIKYSLLQNQKNYIKSNAHKMCNIL